MIQILIGHGSTLFFIRLGYEDERFVSLEEKWDKLDFDLAFPQPDPFPTEHERTNQMEGITRTEGEHFGTNTHLTERLLRNFENCKKSKVIIFFFRFSPFLV